MTPLFALKPTRLKTRKRRLRLYVACLSLIGVAGFVGGLSSLSHMERFAITAVEVTGILHVPSEAITATINTALEEKRFSLFSHKNMFLYPKAVIERSLSDEFPRIKNVTVSKESLLAQAIVVTLAERNVYALWCAEDTTCYSMDEDGYIFAPQGEAPQTNYIFKQGLTPNQDVIGQTFLQGRMKDIRSLMTLLKAAGFVPHELSVDSEKDFTVSLTNGPKLRLLFETMPEDAVHNLETALTEESLKSKLAELEYIDLRFGNRVYFK